jgi:SPP1 family predicted phage head-tail adaptor
MAVGELDKRIIIESDTKVSDDMGGYTTTWATYTTVWAAIWPMSAKEQLQNMQSNMEVSHRIRIRYMDSFSNDYRIKYGSRYFNIVSVINPREKGEWLDLLCKEVS